MLFVTENNMHYEIKKKTIANNIVIKSKSFSFVLLTLSVFWRQVKLRIKEILEKREKASIEIFWGITWGIQDYNKNRNFIYIWPQEVVYIQRWKIPFSVYSYMDELIYFPVNKVVTSWK